MHTFVEKHKNGIMIDRYSSRDAKTVGGLPFDAVISGLVYDVQDNYSTSTRSATMQFSQSSTAWKNLAEKKKYAKYKLNKDQVGAIDFSHMTQKLKSVKPKKGKALRRQMNREDDELFCQMLAGTSSHKTTASSKSMR